jgi:hypothetical protein
MMKTWTWVLACAAALSALPARADELVLNGAVLDGVSEIVEVDGPGGRITFVYQGRQMTQTLAGLELMDLARCPLLGQAFKAAKAARHEQAATMFQQVAASAPEQWIATLATGQAARSADQAGRFADAVSAYIAWVNGGWSQPKIPPPANLPPRDSPDLLLAIRRLNDAAAAAASDDAKLKFRTLLLKTYERQGDERAVALSRELLAAAAATPSAGELESLSARDNALLAPVRQAVAAREYDQALARARQAGKELSRAGLADLFMLAGQCYEAKNDPARAGLCYMRLVIHFPADRQSPEAMLRSARIAESFGRAESAKRLYETLAQRYAGTPQASAARAALSGKKN